jgi:hypothetical protein
MTCEKKNLLPTHKKNIQYLSDSFPPMLALGLLMVGGISLTSSLTLAAPTQAQQSLTRAVNKCALISSASKRLQCFDRLTGRATTVLDQAMAANNPTVAKTTLPSLKPRSLKMPNNPTAPLNSKSNLKPANTLTVVSNTETILADKKQAFGKTTLSDIDREKEVNSIDVVFTSAQKNTLGKWVFKTDDGQIWRQTDTRVSYFRKVPFNAVINKGALSAFYMKPADGNPAIKIKRVN